MGGRKRRALAGIALGFIATGDYLHNIVLGARAVITSYSIHYTKLYEIFFSVFSQQQKYQGVT